MTKHERSVSGPDRPDMGSNQRRIAELERLLADREAEVAALRSLADNLPVMTCTFLPDTTLTYVNKAYCDYFGLPKERLVGQRFIDFTPEEVAADIRTCLAALTPDNPIATNVHKGLFGGTEVWLQWTDRAFFNERGEVVRFQAMGFDITDRVQAEQDMRESQERFKLAMEASRDGLWDWDTSTNEVYFSPGYEAMLGYETGELRPHIDTWLSLLHPDDREAALKDNMDCLEGHSDDFEIEFRLQAKDGTWRWVQDRGKAVARDDRGRARRMIGTHSDITESKRVEEALRAALEKITFHVENSPLAVIEWGPDYEVISWSTRAEDLFGWRADEILGRRWDELGCSWKRRRPRSAGSWPACSTAPDPSSPCAPATGTRMDTSCTARGTIPPCAMNGARPSPACPWWRTSPSRSRPNRPWRSASWP